MMSANGRHTTKLPPLPQQGEHVAIFGKTGSGKTFLASSLVCRFTHVVCLDTKRQMDRPKNHHLWRDKGFRFYSDLHELKLAAKRGQKRLVYQPDYTEFENRREELADYDDFFQWVYTRGNCVCYVDEAYMVCDGNHIPRYYRALLTQGRELGVSCYASSQRTVSIAQPIISESSHIYSFHLKLEQDRDKLTYSMGYDCEFLRRVKLHWFYYLNEYRHKGPYILD